MPPGRLRRHRDQFVFEAERRVPPRSVAFQAHHPAQSHDGEQRSIDGQEGPALFGVAAMQKGWEVGLDQPFLGGWSIGHPIVAEDLDQVAQGIALAALLPVDPADGAVVAYDRVAQAGIPLDEAVPRFL